MVQLTTILSSLGLLISLASAKPVQSRKYEYSVKEVHNPPRKWTRLGPAPGDAVLNLHIGLKMSRWDDLERNLHEVSDPFHPRYGKHLTQAEVNEFAKPADDALEAVHDWLESHGYTADNLRYSPAKEWVKITLPVEEAERLLKTKYSIFKHEDGTELIRTPEWSLPKDLHQHVVAVQPTNSFLRAGPKRRTFKPVLEEGETLASTPEPAELKKAFAGVEAETQLNEALAEMPLQQACNVNGVTPACLRNLYKTVNYVPKALDKNSVAFANYLNETSVSKDLTQFLRQYRPDAATATINFTIVNNGANFQDGLTPEQMMKQLNAEGNLDGQTLVGMVHPMRVRAYNTGGSPPFIPDAFTKTNTNEPYLEWLNWMLANEKDLPWVVSTSYGDDEQTVPQSYAVSVCQQMAALGARGVTLLFASGDNGVGGDGACFTNDGKETPQFLPSFPVSCPYVTAVGGTKNFAPEVAAYDPRNGFASGGGFSNYFARPAWQDSVVSTYVKAIGQNYTGLYNTTGRAYPDIAAQGQQYAVVWNGRNILLDGTSASTPTMAGVIALLNDYLISNGKSPLGFMNPWLYSVGFKAFTDVASGGAKGCEGEGFLAGQGWDAVTGFGTPDFLKLQQIALQSPPGQNGAGAGITGGRTNSTTGIAREGFIAKSSVSRR